MDVLYASIPGFDQPIAVLKHCHDRIRKQLNTLGKLQAYLAEREGVVDEQAQSAAQAVLNYFQKAAPLHHEDEEIDLFPAMRAAIPADDAAVLAQLLTQILAQHEQMAQLWQDLERPLLQIAAKQNTQLSEAEIQVFTQVYASHMQIEEAQIAVMAERYLSVQQMAQLSASMRARRGIGEMSTVSI